MLRWLATAASGTALALQLAACGGGGGSSEAAPAPGAAAEIVIVSFAPAQGAPGTVLTVSGSGLTAVTAARVGGASAAFTVDSATQARVTVPAGAASGRIELSDGGRVALSASDFTVVAVAQVAAVTPTTLLPPGRISVTGVNLNLVAQARINTTALAIAAQSATSLSLDVPAAAATGLLTLVGNDGVARATTQQITMAAPMVISALAPATVVQGGTLSITGTNLNRAQSVLFAGGASANITARLGSTGITVVVPDAAATGNLTVVGDLGDRVISGGTVTVVPLIRVTNATTNNVAAGASITLAGSGFAAVSGVTVGAVTAVITARSDTQLTLTVPATVTCGAISLQSALQPAVNGGTVVVGNGCALRVASIEYAQVLAQETGDVRQRLAPGKETLVRVFVVAEAAGTVAPVVRVSGIVNGSVLGTIAASGPPTLPVLAAAAAVPATLRYDESQTFNASLPAAWVAAGLSLRVEVDPGIGAPIVANSTPTVGSLTRLNLVIVPLVSGTFAPTLPLAADVVNELIRRLPIAADRVTVAVRAPYTLTSVIDGLDTDTEWSNALVELNQLRQREAPTSNYYGFVRRAGGSIAGIGYVGAPASLGWDSASSWRRTFTHELGHNFGRSHAPCGGVASADPSYPYAGGVMSGTPLFDSLLDDIIAPTGSANSTDVMGYCGGGWFSDYNYRAVQNYLESRPQAAVEFALSAAPVAELIGIGGSIGPDGLTLQPVQALRGVSTDLPAGEYTLRLLTVAGNVVELPFDAYEVDHAVPPQRHFFLQLPNPGPLAQVEVLHAGALLPRRAADLAQAQARLPLAGLAAAPFIDWREADQVLTLRWNAAAQPFMTATHVAGGARTVLALNLRGGVATLSTAALPAGGSFELGLSDGLNTQLVTVAR